MQNILSLPAIWILIYSLMTQVEASMGWRTSVQVTATRKWEKSLQKRVLYQHNSSTGKYTPANTYVRPVFTELYQYSQKPQNCIFNKVALSQHCYIFHPLIWFYIRSWRSHLSYFCRYTDIKYPWKLPTTQGPWQWPS